MSIFANAVWLLIYSGVVVFGYFVPVSVLLYCIGVGVSYSLIEKWNRLRSDTVVSRPELRVIVRPETTRELEMANFYRVPFFFLIWLPTSVGFILFGKEMAAEIGPLALTSGLVVAQLVLFDFINLEIRARIIAENK